MCFMNRFAVSIIGCEVCTFTVFEDTDSKTNIQTKIKTGRRNMQEGKSQEHMGTVKSAFLVFGLHLHY